MIRRSVVSGTIAGLLLCLASLFPVFSIYVFPQFLQMAWPAWPVWLRSLALLFNGVVGFIVFCMIGGLAALRKGVTCASIGFKAGAVSGLTAGVILYIIIVSPTTSLAASAQVWAEMPESLADIPAEMLIDLLHQLTWGMLNNLTLCLVITGLMGGLQGALIGHLRQHHALPSLSLLEVIDLPRPRRRWFADDDETWRAGLIAGIVSGLVMGFGLTIGFVNQVEMDWPRLQGLLNERGGAISRLMFSQPMVGLLSPFVILMMISTGALAILLLKDPPSRYWSRFLAAMIAGGVAAVAIYLAISRNIYFYSGMSQYFVYEMVQASPEADAVMAGEFLLSLDAQAMIVPMFYLFPLLLFFGVFLAALVWMVPQALLYSLILPLFVQRPADRAARIVSSLREEPSGLLPRLYTLFKQDAQAMQVLPHLAFLLHDTAAAQTVAAYHNLGRSENVARAVSVVRQMAGEQEIWRWRAEVGALYRVLEQGLAAQTLDQVRHIDPPPESITSSLPPLLAKSCAGIGRILGELQKVGRVDDLNTKIIFLNSAQAALLDLRRYLTQEPDESPRVLYPEVGVLNGVLERWQALVLAATNDLQGRADLRSTLTVKQADMGERVRQALAVTNHGLNVAQNVRLRIDDGEGYQVVEGGEQQVDILGPQESRQFEFWLQPAAPGRLRLTWRLTFDDAVDDDRHVDFADVMQVSDVAELSANARPFQRIFPIPYVTGTPLRSNEMFVGRQDVFDFVRENLLGAYQNNVIVLHGQRRTGKTSILYRLQEVLADTHIAVLVDMQGKAARGAADFLYALSDDIAYVLENNDIIVELPEREEYEKAPEFAFRSRFLRSAIGKMDGGQVQRNLLLMFDEFEELQKRVEDGKLETEIFTFLRNLMQHERRVDFIFSGTHKLEELGADYWSILFNIAAYKRITFLSPDEARRLIVEPVAAYEMEYDPLAIDRIIQATAGHPYFTQVVCHELVSYHNETQRNYITTACVDQALEQILERGEAHFKYIWTGAAPDEQRVLLALTDLLPDAESTTAPHEIVAELARKGQAMSEDVALEALTRLQARDIVTRSGPQSALYRFKIDLIRRWIAVTRPAAAALGMV